MTVKLLLICAVLLLAFAVTSNLVALTVRASDSVNTVSIKTELCHFSDGEIMINLRVCGNIGLCGAFLEIDYNATALAFVSLADVNSARDIDISYRDLGGRLFILMDGYGNCDVDTRFASICFKIISPNLERLDIRLKPIGGDYAFYRSENGEILSVGAELEGLSVSIANLDLSDERVSAPKNIGISLLTERGNVLSAGLQGECPEGGFVAVGFKLFVVDMNSGIGERIFASKCVPNKDTYGLTVDAPLGFSADGDLVCLLIPVMYTSKGAFFGERYIFIVIDGNVIYENANGSELIRAVGVYKNHCFDSISFASFSGVLYFGEISTSTPSESSSCINSSARSRESSPIDVNV